MKISSYCVALLGSAALIACGGDSPKSPGGGATPTPTPSSTTPAPTPAPTPTFSYTAFGELTGDQDFPTACVGYGPRGNGVPGIEGIHPFLFGGLIDYAAGNQTWTVAVPNSLSETFGPADLVTLPPQPQQGDVEKSYEKPDGSGQQEYFLISRPSVAGVAAEYGRFAAYGLGDGTGFAASALCAFGVPTDPEDIPSEELVTYSDLVVNGWVYESDGYGGGVVSGITGGSGTIRGSTINGELAISFNYHALNGNSTTEPIEGVLTVDRTDEGASYSGLLNMDKTPEYRIVGAFFGPQGIETGFVFVAWVDGDSNGLNEKFIVGRVFSRR